MSQTPERDALIVPSEPFEGAVARPSFDTVPETFATAQAKRPNLAVGITAGVGLGFLAALAYAGLSVWSGKEYLVFGLMIGFAVAFGFHKFGHTRGVVAGLIAALITCALYIIAIFVETAGMLAQEYDASLIDGLRAVVQNAGEVMSVFFSDVVGVLFLVASVAWAFIAAFDRKSFDKRNGL